MTLKTLQNFYRAVITTGLETGTGSCYVSVLPTPSAGYLVINPSNVTKREIVAYSGTGTDEGGSYVTLTTRGVGGTTEQAHDVNEPVRLNVTAEYYSDIQTELNALSDEIDTLVLQNAPNASTTTRGIVLMATAPAEAGTAIVVGTNDPRLTPPTGEPSAFVAASSGAVNAGSGVVLNASGLIDVTMMNGVVKRQYEYADSPATWTKPTNLKAVKVHVWGGGGSGARNTTDDAGGGGGGAFMEAFIPTSVLGSTVTVTIGAGGAAKTTTGDGNDGGTSSFGTLVIAYGGEGGHTTSSGLGGGGGGIFAIGAAGVGGSPLGGASAAVAGLSTFGGGGTDTDVNGSGGASVYGGGGGGTGGTTGIGGAGGSSYYGGAGGGGQGQTAGANGGTSILGGNGGTKGGAGSVPGGGGGGNKSADSGAGGNGRVIVYEFY